MESLCGKKEREKVSSSSLVCVVHLHDAHISGAATCVGGVVVTVAVVVVAAAVRCCFTRTRASASSYCRPLNFLRGTIPRVRDAVFASSKKSPAVKVSLNWSKEGDGRDLQ